MFIVSEAVLTHNENSYSVFICADDENPDLRKEDVCSKGASIRWCSLRSVNFFRNTHNHKVLEMIEADGCIVYNIPKFLCAL